MRKLKIILVVLFISNISFAQSKWGIRIESGTYIKELKEDIYGKVSASYTLFQKEGESFNLLLGGGVEIIEDDNKLLVPIFLEWKTEKLCVLGGGEFAGSWCSMLLTEFNIVKDFRISTGVRIGDFNELILGICYNL